MEDKQFKNIEYRIEKDSMGEVKVPSDKLWKSQTQRSLNNFSIGDEKMPTQIIKAIVLIKKSIALVNGEKGNIEKKKSEAIANSCDLILAGQHLDQFPLYVWQTGSGTQTNMNVNEVISSLAKQQFDVDVHPNDDVNKCQSTNDVFPSAIHVSTYVMVKESLLPALQSLIDEFDSLMQSVPDVIKIGRTHLQDATPVSVRQEISAWQFTLQKAYQEISSSLAGVLNLAIGGTAVGTGINTFAGYSEQVVAKINSLTKYQFKSSKNKFYSLASKSELLAVHSSINSLAMELIKIGNDIRWLASGPRAGIGEYIIPSNEPGSSIMPGKVNPTQVEALTMVCAQVLGNQTSISFACSQGNFQLNAYMPLIAYNMIQSVQLLTDMMDSFRKNLVAGTKINERVIKDNLEKSLMTVTALNPYIGYDNSAKLSKYAYENDLSLFEANEKLNILSDEDLRKYLDYSKMV